MKQIITLIASALVLFAGCKEDVNNAKIYAEFNADMEALVADYNKQYAAILQNATVAHNETDAKVEELEEKVTKAMKDRALKVIKSYPSDSVAVAVLSDIQPYFDLDELHAVVKKIKGPAAQMEEFVKIRKSLDAKLSTSEGNMFTDFTIVQDPNNPDETTFNLSDIVGKGKYVLVDFWSWWCGPCKKEVPNLINVYNRFAGDNFDMLSISVWERGTPEKCTEVAAELGMCWNQVINGNTIPTDAYGIDGIPHIILFGPDGTILKRDLRGFAITTELEKYIK